MLFILWPYDQWLIHRYAGCLLTDTLHFDIARDTSHSLTWQKSSSLVHTWLGREVGCSVWSLVWLCGARMQPGTAVRGGEWLTGTVSSFYDSGGISSQTAHQTAGISRNRQCCIELQGEALNEGLLLEIIISQIITQNYDCCLTKVLDILPQSFTDLVNNMVCIYCTVWLFAICEKCESFLYISYMSRLVTKPTKWVCAQRRLRSAWASTQSDQSLRCVLNG